MPRVVGYGEDALTFWALTKKIGSILRELKDNSEPEDCLVLYRPSFGRGKRIREPDDRIAEFGEFDAILITPQSGFLVESKWDNLRVDEKPIVKLSEIQIFRHEIFAWYFSRWGFGNNWDEFVEKYGEEFERRFGKQRKVAPPQSILSENLKYILNLMHNCKKIGNVLLYFYRKGFPRPKIKLNSGSLHFDVVAIEYYTIDKSNLVAIHPS